MPVSMAAQPKMREGLRTLSAKRLMSTEPMESPIKNTPSMAENE